ncbi:13439_t:CDS:2 [Cetraspora pellucida]|uniref:13439_t:CDS:1 n=1 Tax=Cetraspora pellucida TaxID=1433469 RepID=A0ACA9LJ90_9GLOM|nr:13439_t:CDS:2 [Cetraspora pellucida]
MYQSLITIKQFAYPHTEDHIEDFLCKVLAKWNMFDKVSLVVTNNASSMIKAIRQLGTTQLGCIAHTIHLVVMDSLKKYKALIRHARLLNNSLVNRDKYQLLFRKIQLELIEKKLTINLKNNSDHTVYADDNSLAEKILPTDE